MCGAEADWHREDGVFAVICADVHRGRHLREMPVVQYAKSGDVNIAYQVAGEGPFDLVFVPGFVTHLQIEDGLPTFAPVLARLHRFRA
jgi:hypothetical protein